jgi:hypothetical protein
MNALDRLIGSWDFTMHHVAMSEPITGHQDYERVLDDAFVLLRWTYDHPDFPDAMIFISEERYHYFDVRGIARIFDFDITDDGWSMVRFDDDFSQRLTARFTGPDDIEGSGEASRDAGTTWQPDFTITCRRA